LPPAPDTLSTGAVLARLCDGLGFRLHWATEGLREEDIDFRPAEGSLTTRELLQHIHRMVQWVDHCLGGEPASEPRPDFRAERSAALTRIQILSHRLRSMSEKDLAQAELTRGETALPIWNAVNGPLADALTHVGQINTYRRVSGNPSPRINHLLGEQLTE
jgi:hypothetical protein